MQAIDSIIYSLNNAKLEHEVSKIVHSHFKCLIKLLINNLNNKNKKNL